MLDSWKAIVFIVGNTLENSAEDLIFNRVAKEFFWCCKRFFTEMAPEDSSDSPTAFYTISLFFVASVRVVMWQTCHSKTISYDLFLNMSSFLFSFMIYKRNCRINAIVSMSSTVRSGSARQLTLWTYLKEMFIFSLHRHDSYLLLLLLMCNF